MSLQALVPKLMLALARRWQIFQRICQVHRNSAKHAFSGVNSQHRLANARVLSIKAGLCTCIHVAYTPTCAHTYKCIHSSDRVVSKESAIGRKLRGTPDPCAVDDPQVVDQVCM